MRPFGLSPPGVSGEPGPLGRALLCVVAAGGSGKAHAAVGLDGAVPAAAVAIAAVEVPTSSVSISSIWKGRPLKVESVTGVGSSGRLASVVAYSGKCSTKIGGVGW